MKLLNWFNAKHVDAINDLKEKVKGNKFYLLIYFLVIFFITTSVFSYKPLYIGISIMIFVIAQYLNSFLYGYFIREEGFFKEEVSKSPLRYIDYTQRGVYTIGLAVAIVSFVSLPYVIPSYDISSKRYEVLTEKTNEPNQIIQVQEIITDGVGEYLGTFFTGLGTVFTILALSLAILMFIDTQGKEKRRSHQDLKKEEDSSKVNEQLVRDIVRALQNTPTKPSDLVKGKKKR